MGADAGRAINAPFAVDPERRPEFDGDVLGFLHHQIGGLARIGVRGDDIKGRAGERGNRVETKVAP